MAESRAFGQHGTLFCRFHCCRRDISSSSSPSHFACHFHYLFMRTPPRACIQKWDFHHFHLYICRNVIVTHCMWFYLFISFLFFVHLEIRRKKTPKIEAKNRATTFTTEQIMMKKSSEQKMYSASYKARETERTSNLSMCLSYFGHFKLCCCCGRRFLCQKIICLYARIEDKLRTQFWYCSSWIICNFAF